MQIFYFLGGLAVGNFCAFQIFALGFNGSSWQELALMSLAIAAGSGGIGRFLQSWKVILSGFFLPFLLLDGLLIMGSLEEGGWSGNLGLIALTSLAIWAPAWVARKSLKGTVLNRDE